LVKALQLGYDLAAGLHNLLRNEDALQAASKVHGGTLHDVRVPTVAYPIANGKKRSGKRVLAIEDGPTTTHGGMTIGAGVIAARQHGAAELIDPRPWAEGELARTFEKYPAIGPLLPAMGYGETQVRDLEATINAVDCDLVLVATPIDLTRLVNIDKPHMRIGYRLEASDGAIADAVKAAVRAT
jgi:predicted GTPase